MATCVAKREGKLIDERFIRPLNEREKRSMEDHLTACGVCRERYRKLQLADRVVAFGEEIDQPAPAEIDRIAHDLGLFDAPRNPPWFAVKWFGAAASVAALAVMLLLFVKPSDELVERGGTDAVMTFSAYAIAPEGPRLLENGARVTTAEHLKLRASGDAHISGVEVLLVASDGTLDHVHLAAPQRSTVPGAISLSGLPPGKLTAYVVAAPSFDLEKVRPLAARRADPQDLARALGDASVERIELEVAP
jgi:hypothetical protein